ncbi:solute carrier family 22 member 11 [Phyllostomus discolor]|uniref:Solute carrier family 22 member 11 n=1 Tax=Phyllostomus discolor TaxID=89673 RepID=A0A834E6X5_9CHIR|nr:solute carrier family 22 member 11 [Phyllostomus discolor]
MSPGNPDRALQELRNVARINGVRDAKKTLTTEVLMCAMEEAVASARAFQSPLDRFRVPTLCRRSCCLLSVGPEGARVASNLLKRKIKRTSRHWNTD